MTLTALCIAVGAAYLAGSIPFGVVIARAHGIDIRRVGSGNIGATNVGRMIGRRWGILCFVLDGLKGLLPVLIAGFIAGPLRPDQPYTAAALGAWMLVVAATVIGHMSSIFLGFRGGKGVATSFGACLGIWPVLTIPILCAVLLFVFILRRWRMMSLASVVAAGVLPLLVVAWALIPLGDSWSPGLETIWPVVLLTAVLAASIVWRHRANIGRIRRGEEPKIGAR